MLVIALDISTYNLTGGCFNAALIMGGMIFENKVDRRYIGVILGQIIGCLISRLMVWQIWGEGEKHE